MKGIRISRSFLQLLSLCKEPGHGGGAYILPSPPDVCRGTSSPPPHSSHFKLSMPIRESEHRAYVFTCNNYTDTTIELLGRIKCKYLIYGREVAPTTGTPHLQGYISFASGKTMSRVCKLIPSTSFQVARGTLEENQEYTTKEGDYTERGEPPKDPRAQGDIEKERWSKALTCCKVGDLSDIPADILLRYYSSCVRIQRDFAVKPLARSILDNRWYWGESGTGKSSSARAEFPDAFIKSLSKWWDHYKNEKEVIIDDFDPFHKVLGYELKLWADHYPFPAETKGGTLLIRPAVLIVTSQYPPDRIWDDVETIAAIRRRFKVKHFCSLDALPVAPVGDYSYLF